MKDVTEYIIVEFSVKQQAFHKQTLDDMLVNNIKNIFQNRETDYLPVGIFKSHDIADDFISLVYNKFKKSETILQQEAAINFINKSH